MPRKTLTIIFQKEKRPSITDQENKLSKIKENDEDFQGHQIEANY